MKNRGESEQKSQGRAYQNRQQKTFRHPNQAQKSEPADPLIHLTVLEKRVKDVRLALFPGFHRGWQVQRYSRADDRPNEQHGPDTQ
jgi:hypothetical protein